MVAEPMCRLAPLHLHVVTHKNDPREPEVIGQIDCLKAAVLPLMDHHVFPAQSATDAAFDMVQTELFRRFCVQRPSVGNPFR